MATRDQIRIELASQGITAAGGGMNIPEIKQLLAEHGIQPANSSRKAHNEALLVLLSRPSKAKSKTEPPSKTTSEPRQPPRPAAYKPPPEPLRPERPAAHKTAAETERPAAHKTAAETERPAAHKTAAETERPAAHKELGDLVYNPHYDQAIPKDSSNNCSDKRPSLSKKAHISRLESKVCDVLPLQQIKYILGPRNYRHLQLDIKSKGTIQLQFFGEEHKASVDMPVGGNKKNTVTFVGYIKSLVTQTPMKIYDLYVELPPMLSGKFEELQTVGPDAVTLAELQESFYSCRAQLAICPYQNLRVHFVDFRDEYEKTTRLSDAYTKTFEIAHLIGIDDPYDNKKHMRGFTQLSFEEFSHNKFTQSVRLLLDDFNKNTKIRKQLNNCFVGEQLLAYIQQYVNERAKKYLEVTRFVPDWKARLTTNMVLAQELAIHFVDLYGLMMDTYAIARMLRTYRDGSYARNIIYYAGAYHTGLAEHFIEHLGGQIKQSFSQPEHSTDAFVEL